MEIEKVQPSDLSLSRIEDHKKRGFYPSQARTTNLFWTTSKTGSWIRQKPRPPTPVKIEPEIFRYYVVFENLITSAYSKGQ